MRYWWVNHNSTFEAEVQGGFLWSPKENRNGRKNHFYDNMTRVDAGDIVFSFCDTKIQAVGIATAVAQTTEKPNFGPAGQHWNSEGWLVPVEFKVVENPIRPKDFIRALCPLLPVKYSPLQQNGNGNQGVYLAEISEAVSAELLRRLNLDIADLSTPSDATGIDALDEEADAQQVALSGRTDIGATQKAQLILSRRGQGVFKANVRLNEKACRVTGVTAMPLLIASHIRPWSRSNDRQKLDGCNGLLLSPHIDWLFDRGLLSFHQHGSMLVSSKLDPSVLQRWNIDTGINVGLFTAKQEEYLSYHRTKIFKQ